MSQSGAATPAPALPRIGQFDAMRGIGVTFVVITHCWWIFPTSPMAAAVRKMLPISFIGMDMFFVISGYLITGILMRSLDRGKFFRTFYLRRALRILPAYYLCLLVLFLVLPLADPQLKAAGLHQHAWAYLLHVQNWLFCFGPDIAWPGTQHWWSLAVEEQYYFLWPLLVWFTRTPAAMRRACVLVIAMALAAKGILVATDGSWFVLHMSTVTRLDGLALGSLIATLPRELGARWGARCTLLAFAAFGVIGVLIWLQPSEHSVPYFAATTTLAVAMFGAICLRIHGGAPAGRLLRTPLFVWLGERSYSIYLIHLPLFFVLMSNIQPYREALKVLPTQLTSALIFFATVAVTLPLAAAMHRYVEMPALNLRHRWVPDRQKRAEASAMSKP